MSKLIAIDNGHGLNTAGKRTPKMPDGKVIHEWQFNHATAKKFEAAAKRNGFRTLMVSDTSADTALRTRTDRANNAKADVFVSFHFNALAGRWGTHGGIETLYNTGSSNGAKLARLVQSELIKASGLRNRGAKARNNLHVLRATNMPAILPECGFMDNLEEAKLMLNANYQDKMAEATLKGMCQYFGVKYVPPGNAPSRAPSVSKPAANIYYGENSKHNTKSGVTKLQNDLISLGFSVGIYGADGSFGGDTKNAILRFQKVHKLKQDGFAGQETLAKIASEIAKKGSAAKKYYRVRSSWANASSQKGAFEELERAITRAKENKGYNVYDDKGKMVYEAAKDVPKPAPKPPVIETKPTVKPEILPPKTTAGGTPITGNSVATALQMEALLKKINPEPKIYISPYEFCKLFIDEGRIEGIRGDIAFCQAMKETGWLRFGGQVLPKQNNYSGIGATNNSPVGKGAWFKDAQEGIRAQIQHLKAYANKESVKNVNVDPRFHLVARGVAPNWEDLNGRWAVPGKNYGQEILEIFEELSNIDVGPDKLDESASKEIIKLKAQIIELEKKNRKIEEELRFSNRKLLEIKDIVG